jgi:uncharacterized protein
MRLILVVGVHLLIVTSGQGQERPPIIDMHLHAMPIAGFANLLSGPPVPHCVPMTDYPMPEPARPWLEIFQMADPPCNAIWSPETDGEALTATLEIMKRRNVVAAVTSGPLVHRWREAAPNLIIPQPLVRPRAGRSLGGFVANLVHAGRLCSPR